MAELDPCSPHRSPQGWPGRAILELAEQLRSRSGCHEIVRITADIPVVDTSDRSVETCDVSAFGLAHNAVPSRRAGRAVLVIDADVLLVPSRNGRQAHALRVAIRRMVMAAPFSILVSDAYDQAALGGLVASLRVIPSFIGSNRCDDDERALAICEAGDGPSTPSVAPPDFSVTAYITAFNEEDVLDTVLDDLEEQGVQAHVLDNWSTDATWDIVQARRGEAVVGAERWPEGGPADYFDLRANLDRVAELAAASDADWCIKHDADEIRRAPWPGVRLVDAFWMAQCAGYNVVDFTVMNYEPVDNGFQRGLSLWEYFRYFGFGNQPGHFRQLKAWRNFGQSIDYARFGSHSIAFEGRRIFPYKFQLHHYPVRSQDHGARKILVERQARYLPAARQRGWHSHYDGVSETTSFVRGTEELLERTDDLLDAWVVERLSGAGLERDG